MSYPKRLVLTCLILLSLCQIQAALPLAHGPSRDVSVTPEPDRRLRLKITGNGPHFWTGIINTKLDQKNHQILAFDYFSPKPLKSFAVRYRDKDGNMVFAGSKPMPLAETWQPFFIDLAKAPKFPDQHDRLRFHFQLVGKIGTELQIRNLRLRPANAEEKQAANLIARRQAEREEDAQKILAQLRKEFPCSIESIHNTGDRLIFSVKTNQKAYLQEHRPHLSPHANSQKTDNTSIEIRGTKASEISFNRYAGKRDRSLSRWRLTDEKGNPLSQNHWVDSFDKETQRDLPKLKPSHPKGLGGMVHINTPDHQIFDLGIQHATVNFVLTSILSTEPKRGWTPYRFNEHQFYFNESSLRWRDETIKRLSDNNIVVTCILLVGNHRDAEGNPTSLMTHPEAETRGIYSIPNFTTVKSTALYQAVLHLLAERYSREDRSHGRISNWVLHNEVDQAGTWTNMGDQPLARYVETYMRSARTVYLTMSSFNPHARVFPSITHHWNKQSTGHGTYHARNLIDLFAEFATVEGDFEWGLTYHPYPQNLRNPDTWNDTEVTFDFDTPYITPKNLEVLPAYMMKPHLLFQGRPRGILLSEQGFNSPTLSKLDQERQAAGLIYTFRKLRKLPSIEAYHLHRYQDMPLREGNLRLGIITETGEHKVGWGVYKAIGTDREKEFDALADRIIRETSSK